MLRSGKKSDVVSLAKIHLLEFSSDFLPSLGQSFLRLLYSDFLQNKNVSVLVEDLDSQVQGFIVGSRDFRSVFKNIIIKNLIKYMLILIPQVIKNPKLIKNIIETSFYLKKEGIDTPKAELVIIAILKKYQRRGLGRNLTLALEKDFISQKIKTYKVSVDSKNVIANSFYLSLGFIKSHDFYIYNRKFCLLKKYIK